MSERACPFCSARLPVPTLASSPVRRRPLSRAALVFASAAAMTSVGACKKTARDHEPPPTITIYGPPPIDTADAAPSPSSAPDAARSTAK